MVRVMASGVFDLLHSGHLHFLEEARKLGDELVVVVATDKTVREKKHEPITNEEMRLKMVAALRPVDLAVLGKEGDMFEIVAELKPDIIALGFDQLHDINQIEGLLAEKGMDTDSIRMMLGHTNLKTTQEYLGQSQTSLIDKNKRFNPVLTIFEKQLSDPNYQISPSEVQMSGRLRNFSSQSKP